MTTLYTHLTQKIGTELENTLSQMQGGRFTVLPRSHTALEGVKGYRIENPPNFVITDQQTQSVYFVEVKGYDPSTDLPLASLPALRNVMQQNKDLNPQIVLVSASSVPTLLALELKREGVHIIEAAKTPNVVREIARAVTSGSTLGSPRQNSR